MGLSQEILAGIWNTKQQTAVVSKHEAFNKHLQRLSNHFSEPALQYQAQEATDETNGTIAISTRGKYRKIIWTAAVAASLVIGFMFIPGLISDKGSRKAHAQNIVSTKRGSKSKIELPDGTQVWLNADSRITYDENFHGAQREVSLSGEAFFDVVRDENRPFVIHTPTIDVKVLGTAFNVRSYENEKNTETSLIRGSVEITLVKSPDKKKIILKPNDKLIVNNHKASFHTDSAIVKDRSKNQIPVMTLAKINYQQKDSSAIETLWVNNKLAFDGEPLEEIALKIERWFDVKVNIADERMKRDSYTAVFEEENLQQVMATLQMTGKFKYTINKKEVTIRP
ncbi:MAG TPA: FecR family protein, partial [Chitinophagaceae bacterium]